MDLDKLQRRLARLTADRARMDEKYNGKESNYTFWGGYELGYCKGKISEIEKTMDELSSKEDVQSESTPIMEDGDVIVQRHRMLLAGAKLKLEMMKGTSFVKDTLPNKKDELERDLASVLNKHCIDVDLNIADFYLARALRQYLDSVSPLLKIAFLSGDTLSERLTFEANKEYEGTMGKDGTPVTVTFTPTASGDSSEQTS